LTGEIILQQQNVNSIDISNYAAGLYFILYKDEQGQFINKSKIVKK